MQSENPTDGENRETDDSGAPKITQADIDKIVQDRLHRQKQSLEKQFSARSGELLSERLSEYGLSIEDLDGLKEKQSASDKDASELKKIKKDLTKLQEEVSFYRNEADKNKSLYSGKVIGDEIEELAQRIGSSSKAQCRTLARLLSDRVRYGDGGFIVLDETGENETSKTLEELVTEHLTSMPFLKGASKSVGTGGRPGDAEVREQKPDLATPAGRAENLRRMMEGAVGGK